MSVKRGGDMLGIPKVEVEDKINYGQILSMIVSSITVLTVGVGFVIVWTRMQERIDAHDTAIREHRTEIRQLGLQQATAAERVNLATQTLSDLRLQQTQVMQSVAVVREDVASIKGLLRQQQQERHAPN